MLHIKWYSRHNNTRLLLIIVLVGNNRFRFITVLLFNVSVSTHKVYSDSNTCNEVLLIVLFSISLFGNAVLGIIVGLQWKKNHRPVYDFD